MATAVFFHAHPDDEAIQTGGTMARMAADGHRVVLVTATRGELGEVPDGVLRPGETLAARRVEELAAASSQPAVRCRCHSVLDECCPDRLRGVIDNPHQFVRPASHRRLRHA